MLMNNLLLLVCALAISLRSDASFLNRKVCLPDVSLPTDSKVLSDRELLNAYKFLTVISSVDLAKFVLKTSSTCKSLTGKLKEECEGIIESIQNSFVSTCVDNQHLLPTDYKYFGTGDNVENLKLLLKNNPFFASSLSASGLGNFHVNSVDGGKTWFSKISTALEASVPRVNADLDSNMDLLSFQYLDPTTNKPIKVNKSKQEAAGDLLFLLSYYVETVHALIHVFHYLNVLAIGKAASVFPKITLWAKPYIANIGAKYKEVALVLLPDSKKVLTGETFKAKGPVVKPILREILSHWGSYKTANQFVDEFIFNGLPKGLAKKVGLLPEFFKHVELIGPFATELSAAFSKADPAKYANAERTLDIFLSSTGKGVSKISDIATWIELMSVTGILHGSTLSLSRHLLTYEMLKRVSPGDKFTKIDSELAKLVGGTVTGVIDSRHVFSSSISTDSSAAASKLPTNFLGLLSLLNPLGWFGLISTIFEVSKSTPTLDPLAREVLLRYDAMSTKIKRDFYEKASADPKFSTQGWILSDHFPDGIDGKQLTITTYI